MFVQFYKKVLNSNQVPLIYILQDLYQYIHVACTPLFKLCITIFIFSHRQDDVPLEEEDGAVLPSPPDFAEQNLVRMQPFSGLSGPSGCSRRRYNDC